MTLTVVEVEDDCAEDVLRIVHAGFGNRPELDPPSTALDETLESVSAALSAYGGLLALLDGAPVGTLLFQPADDALMLRRVSVVPQAQHHGIASALTRTADEVAHRRGYRRTKLAARAELPATVRFWQRAGYAEVARDGTLLTLAKELAVECPAPTAEAMRELGTRLAGALGAGDLVVLTGELGAGKTTLTQGLGRGLQVRGEVTSPTFVISRIHPSLVAGPPLVHVDAYRLGGGAELDDLDLDVSVEDSVTVVEWGEGLAEGLSDDRLEVRISRGTGADADDHRTVRFTPVGVRWVGSDLADLFA